MRTEHSKNGDIKAFCGTSDREMESFTLIELFNLSKLGNLEAKELLDNKLRTLLTKK